MLSDVPEMVENKGKRSGSPVLGRAKWCYKFTVCQLLKRKREMENCTSSATNPTGKKVVRNHRYDKYSLCKDSRKKVVRNHRYDKYSLCKDSWKKVVRNHRYKYSLCKDSRKKVVRDHRYDKYSLCKDSWKRSSRALAHVSERYSEITHGVTNMAENSGNSVQGSEWKFALPLP